MESYVEDGISIACSKSQISLSNNSRLNLAAIVTLMMSLKSQIDINSLAVFSRHAIIIVLIFVNSSKYFFSPLPGVRFIFPTRLIRFSYSYSYYLNNCYRALFSVCARILHIAVIYFAQKNSAT